MKKAADIRKQTRSELLAERTKRLREQFKLRLQKASGNLAKTHELKRVRREIARMNTVLSAKRTEEV